MTFIFAKSTVRRMIMTAVSACIWFYTSGGAIAFRVEDDVLPSGPNGLMKKNNQKAPAREQIQAAERLGVRVKWDNHSGAPICVRGRNLAARQSNKAPLTLKTFSEAMVEEEVDSVLENLAPVYQIRDVRNEFITRQITYDKLNYYHVRRLQFYEGLRVIGGELIIHFNKQGNAYEVNGRYVPHIQTPLTFQCQASEAAERALADFASMGKGRGKTMGSPEPVVFAYKCEPVLAYEILVAGENAARWRYWVALQTGAILLKLNDIKTIASPASGSQATLSGNILSGEDGSSTNITGWYENTGYYYLYNTNLHWYVYNVAVNGYPDNNTYAYRSTNSWGASDQAEVSAARNFDLTQKYFHDIHGRSSFNNGSAWARANVHQGSQYVNAYWDGADFHFGDGDGSTANNLAVLDVCAHEFTHGVTEYSADLYYYGESGALNESFSDIFGACVEFYAQSDGRALYPSKAAGQSDWLLGEDCWLESTALRDMRSPRNTATVGSGGEQPSRYYGTYWYSGSGDNGGVHYNSGVQNFFFYLLSEGGSGDNDGISYNISGIGISNAAQVAYRALTIYCGQYTDYSEVRDAWFSAANDLNPAWGSSVSQVWDAVGVTTYPEVTSASLGQAVNAPQLTWKTWGSTGSYWFAETATTHDGTSAAQSGPIGNGLQSRLDTTVTGPGTFSFYWKVSSEEYWDYLYFYIDGSQQDAISGESGWQSESYTISQGTHTCRWSYIKDTSVADGSDAGWLDQVVWSHAPATPTLASPANGTTTVSLTPTLQASAFSDQDGDSHANSQWQVDNENSFASPEWDSGESYSAGTQTTVPANKLSENTSYYWRVRYKDSQGTWSEWSSACSFTTIQNSSTPPNTPSGVSAGDGVYSDKILIFWNSVASATAYRVWRGIDGNVQNASMLGTATVLFYLDTTAAPGSVYYYWVQAINSAGESALSASDSDSGYCGSISSGLTAPTDVKASDGAYTSRILVSWQTVNNASSYEVWRHSENNRSAAVMVGEPSENSYDDETISQGIYYYYWVRAKDNNGWGSFSAQDAGWSKLSPPAEMNASDGDYRYRIRISWNPVGNAAAYEVWRTKVPSGSSPSGDTIRIGQTTANYIDDYETVAGTIYSYSVRVYNGLGASDYSADTGWRQINSASAESSAINDFDGDRLSDLTVFNPLTGDWEVLCSTLGRQVFTFNTEISDGLSGDFDGDRLADPVVYCADSGTWLAAISTIGYMPIIRTSFGGNAESATVADFDGDRLSDLAAYNENDGILSVMLSNGGAFDRNINFVMGGSGYRPLSADFDGDGKADPAVYSEPEGLLIVMFSSGGYPTMSFPIGGPGQSMGSADFDGDAKADPFFYEEATGTWIVKLSSAGYADAQIVFGDTACRPVIGDYDGDGLADPAIYWQSGGQWLIMLSTSGYGVISETFGGLSFYPVSR